MTNVTTLPPRDPIFALAPELRLHLSERDGKLLVNSREVSRVFGRRHRRLLRKLMEDIRAVNASEFLSDALRDCFRMLADGTIDMTSLGLVFALGGPRWGKRVLQFRFEYALLVDKKADEYEAKTGRNPLTELFEKFVGPEHLLYFTHDGRRCCDDCREPLPAGPILRDELWATIAKPTIAKPDEFLCFDCIEKRLGRELTQADLKVCPFNAGWISFDGADVAALQFARGRRLLPP